jgi:hypothetical protein
MMDKFDHPLGDTEKVVNKFTGECIRFNEVVTGGDLANAVIFILNQTHDMIGELQEDNDDDK